MAPADRLPPHIAALPEEEQGPALVRAIHERKRRRDSALPIDTLEGMKDLFLQQLIWGSADVGEGVVYPREHPYPWNFVIGGRGHGKVARRQRWQEWEERQQRQALAVAADLDREDVPVAVVRKLDHSTRMIGWLDEIQHLEANRLDARDAVVRDIAERAFTNPKRDDTPAVIVRWPGKA